MSDLYAKFNLGITDPLFIYNNDQGVGPNDHAYSLVNIEGNTYLTSLATLNISIHTGTISVTGTDEHTQSYTGTNETTSSTLPINQTFDFEISGHVPSQFELSAHWNDPSSPDYYNNSLYGLSPFINVVSDIVGNDIRYPGYDADIGVGATATYSGQYVIVPSGANPSSYISMMSGPNQSFPITLNGADFVSQPQAFEDQVQAEVSLPSYVWVDLGPAPGGNLSISADQPTITAGNPSNPNATFTVSLDQSLGYPVTVHYATKDGTAVAGTDYTAESGDLTFAAGQTSQTVSVPILNNPQASGNPVFYMDLSNPSASGGSAPAISTSEASEAIEPTDASLFTSDSDNVNFNYLTPAQVSAINNGADLYNSLGGDDTVVLPDPTNYQLTATVAWNPNQTFTMGDGNEALSGGDGNYIVSLGNGSDTVTLGNGTDKITVGNGDDTVTIGGGVDTIALGTGLDSVILKNPVASSGSTITGLQTADSIDFPNVPVASAELNDSKLTVYLESSATKVQYDVSGNLAGSFPFIHSDGNGGTDLLFEPTPLVQINTVINGESLQGSGAIIGPHSILTAAHVVWEGDTGQTGLATNVAGQSATRSPTA